MLYVWRKRCFSAPLSTCAALDDADRIYVCIIFLYTCSDSCYPLQNFYYSSRRYSALQLLIVQVGINPFAAVLEDKPSFYSAAGTHLSYCWS